MRLLIGLLFIFLSIHTQATHIVGGVMGYQCLGINNTGDSVRLRINLRIYRDAINGQAPFDNPAIVGIFTGNNSTPYLSLELYNPVITNAPVALSNPCLSVSPNSVAVEEAIYTTVVTVPINSQGYTLAYQRCCRNQSISNLSNPGSVGATYDIFITPLALQSCNSSPNFNNYPPIVICKDQPINFNHAATDLNGNRLEYSFCHPHTGASQAQPLPNPPSAPPYTLIPFSAGFTPNFPMPANPPLSIDPQSGLLTGVPRQNGQYVVGVCVSEYNSSGALLSTTLRDFQFNVVDCYSNLQAIIRADSVSPGGQRYILNSCNNNTISFTNQSTANPQSLIQTYEWSFSLNNGNFLSSNLQNPTLTFPGPGNYSGWLVLNPGQVDCTDTAFIRVNIFPPLVARFDVLIDSCNPNLPPIRFFDRTTNTSSNPIQSWTWNFGDNTSSSLPNPIHNYLNPGVYIVSLQVRDNNNCISNFTDTISWYPPARVNFTADDSSGCREHVVNFTHNSFPFGPGYSLNWNFGNGNTDTIGPTVIQNYTVAGNYTVSLQIRSPWGCISNQTRNQYIDVFENPLAQFSYSYDSCDYSPIQFINNSVSQQLGASIVNYLWNFQDGTTSNLISPSHLYLNAGTYPLSLLIEDSNGCTDSIVDSVRWYPRPVLNVSIPTSPSCAPYSIFFDNQSYPINGYTTQWNFGDGSFSTVASPTHIYVNPGIYPVSLLITSPIGCQSVFRDTIQVYEPPQSNFNFTFNPCTIGPIQFDEIAQTNSNNDSISSYIWSFGDGNSFSTRDTQYQYTNSGDYQVLLIITDINGCSDTASRNLRYYPSPIVDVQLSDSIGCQPLSINFINNSYPISGYTTTWTFGDGGVSNLASPTHLYQSHGIFLVQLNILSPTGCRGDYADTIQVFQIPNANFSYRYDSCAFSGVEIFDQSTTNLNATPIISWEWDYEISPSFIVNNQIIDTIISFTPRDTYSIRLVVVDSNGCSDTNLVDIAYFPAPVFPVQEFSTEGCLPLTIPFVNNPLNNFPGYQFLWNFGNGQLSNSFDSSYIYTTEGIYFPRLIINTPAGCRDTFVDTIIVNGNPIARFDISYNPCDTGLVRFRNLSIPSQQGIINSSNWDFGDGTTGNLPLSFHQYHYPDTGFYQISLQVTDDNGCTDDSSYMFYWRPQPAFPVLIPDSRGCVPLQVVYNNPLYPSPNYNLQWNFGDGRTSTLASPEIQYNTAGIYTLRLIVRSPIGCIDTSYSYHEALIVPEAGFTTQPEVNLISIFNNDVQFIDQSINAAAWNWNFNDLDQSTLQNPTFSFPDTGWVRVTQIVTHPNGCRDTALFNLDIVPKISYFLPNAFTPNNDGVNDIYMGAGHFEYIQDFSMQIYNRWGEMIYENKNPFDFWNGRKFNTGERCQLGVYVVVVRIKGPRGFEEEIRGFATIVD